MICRHPAVRHSSVIGVPDPVWQQRVVALIEPMREDGAPTLDDIQEHCREHLAGYKIPRALVITQIERTPTGKVDYLWGPGARREDAGSRRLSGRGPARQPFRLFITAPISSAALPGIT